MKLEVLDLLVTARKLNKEKGNDPVYILGQAELIAYQYNLPIYMVQELSDMISHK